MAESFGQLGQCVAQLSWRFLKLNVYAVTQPKETASRLAVLCGHLSDGLEHIADRYTAEQLCEAAGHVLGHGVVVTAVPGALAGAGVGGKAVLDAVAGAKAGLTAASDMVKSAAAAKLVGQYGGEVVTAAVGAVKNSAGEGGVAEIVESVASIQKAAADAVLIGSGFALRKISFFRGLYHGRLKHLFGRGECSLSVLDPHGSVDKWADCIVKLAQNGKGAVNKVPTGEIMEIMGSMQKSGGSDMLHVGVRLFKPHDSNVWKLTTILTEQF